MLLPTVVAIAATLCMLMVAFVWLPTRGHRMPRHFTMRIPEDEEEAIPERRPPAAVVAEEEERTPDGSRRSVLELEAGPSVSAPLEIGALSDGEKMELATAAGDGEKDVVQEGSPPSAGALLMTAVKTRQAKVLVFAAVLLLLSVAQYIRLELWTISFISALIMLVVDLGIVHSDKGSMLSFLTEAYGRMPWAVAPFVLCMFLL